MARPVLSNSCARATTAAESRFRLDYPLAPSRATRVVALDAGAADLAAPASDLVWNHTRFYSVNGQTPAGDAGLTLATAWGESVPLAPELEGVDALLMVASGPVGADAAATIGAACTVRGIMTAGLVSGDGAGSNDTLAMLRPFARILLVPADAEDLVELLRAMRA